MERLSPHCFKEIDPVPDEIPSSSPERTVIRTQLSGYDLLLHPALNKGTAFTEEERNTFGLHGLLPPHIGTLEDQRERRKKALDNQPTSFAKYTLMRDLQDSDETLFYSLIKHNTEELLPIVYTPAVGEGCQRFSEIWRKPRGLFISYPNRGLIDQMLADPRYDEIRCIVVSDGERILGLGDQGAGGMGIPIGKMALYTALGGIPPHHCLPILLDVGTDNQALLHSPIYIGWQHARVRGQEYDDFIEAFVTAVQRRWPHILLQWEDFAGENALRLLDRYRDRLCTFNDDIQGTAAVTTGALFAAVHATGIPLRDQRIAMFGSGSAGVGIIALVIAAMKEQGLSEAEARQRIYAFNRHGLLVEGEPGLRASQMPLARSKADVAGWALSKPGPISLLDTVRNAGHHSFGRSLGPGRCIHRGNRPRDDAPYAAPRHLPALQSDIGRRSHSRRPAPLDGRPRPGRHRQPFRTGRNQWPQHPHFPDQQFLHLSRPRPRHPGGPRQPRDRRHDDGRCQGAGFGVTNA